MSIHQYPQFFDWSTINVKVVRALPAYKLPPTYSLSKHYGSACFLDAPGYPSYFVQHVYTQYGNTPSNSATMIMRAMGSSHLHVVEHAHSQRNFDTWDDLKAWQEGLYRHMWKPLPLAHERVHMWIKYCYAYFRDCYIPPSGSLAANDIVIRREGNWEYCTPERAKAPIYIRSFYPEYQVDQMLLEDAPLWGTIPDWWGRYARPVEVLV